MTKEEKYNLQGLMGKTLTKTDINAGKVFRLEPSMNDLSNARMYIVPQGSPNCESISLTRRIG
jgi:hypothetical protein